MKPKVLFIFLLIVATIQVAEGSQKKTKENPTQPTGQYQLPKPVPLNWFLSANVLPAGYQGDDIIQVYDYLKNIPAKDEFETIDEFIKRARSTFPKQTFAFLKKYYVDYETFPRLVYNAEKHILTIGSNDIFTAFNLKYIPIHIKGGKQTIRKFLASEESGDKIQVTEYGGINYNIIPVNDIMAVNRAMIDISSEDARDLKNNLGLLFVCTVCPNEDYQITSTGITKTEIPFESPIAYNYTNYQINVYINELLIFNSRTGVIFGKIRF